MQKTELSAIRGWHTLSRYGVTVPASVGTVCPFCLEKVVFTLGAHEYDSRRQVAASSASCPACRETVHFWCTGILLDMENEEQQADALYMRPETDTFRDSHDFDAPLPAPLKRSYESAVQSFNVGNHTAASVCCARALEGIFNDLLPEDSHRGDLQSAVEEAITLVDLSRPLSHLSHAVREGGTLAAHFAMEREPDQLVAQAMIELLERLIEYLYVLPEQIEKLDEVLDKAA